MKISQSMLNQAIEALNKVSKAEIKPMQASYMQRELGFTKSEFYYQIQFYLKMKKLEAGFEFEELKKLEGGFSDTRPVLSRLHPLKQ